MNNFSLVEVRKLGKGRDAELVPKAYLILDILKDILGYFVLGYPYDILFGFEHASL